jgi:outer membrane murein-binding lipoprotein Lpp
MKFALMILTVGTLLAGCANDEGRVAFDGHFFRAKVSKVDGQRDVFQVRVKDAAQSIDGARAAARYEATKYCVGLYGNSDIIWTLGPDAPTSALRMDGGARTFQGRCPQ